MLIYSWFENYFTKEIFIPFYANSAEQNIFSSQKASDSLFYNCKSVYIQL